MALRLVTCAPAARLARPAAMAFARVSITTTKKIPVARAANKYGAAPSFADPPARATSTANANANAAAAPPSSSSEATTPTEPTVEELMDPKAPILRETTPLRDAARLFLTTGAQSAPVVDEKGALCGVLSESDLILKSAGVPSEDHWLLPPVYIGLLDATFSLRDEAAWREEVDKILARDVAHAMTSGGGKPGKGGGKKADGNKLIVAAPHEGASVAAGRMARHHVNMLPVVDGEGKVVGTITRHDVLRGLYATQSPML